MNWRHTLMPLRAITDPQGSSDFSNLWAGQALRLGKAMPAEQLTREIAEKALALVGR
ncbi:hypothetical protein D3C76_1444610 [compost metagenome]